MSWELRDSVSHLCDEMNEEGLRVLALAYKDIAVSRANYGPQEVPIAELVPGI